MWKKGYLPKVSVIVANYNKGVFLSKCLDSIIYQTYPNIEIVIVDDCSIDCSKEIIIDYYQKYPSKIFPIFNNRNLGVSKARDKGIKAATGEFIMTLDSDDFLYNEKKIEIEMELILNSKNPYFTVAFSNIVLVNEKDKFLKIVGNPFNIKEGMIYEKLLTRSCFIPRDFIFYKPLYFEIGGYDPQIPIYEDWDLKIRIARIAKFIFSGILGVAYRQTNSGLSKAPKEDHIKWMKYVFEKNLSCISDLKKQKKLRKEFYRNISNNPIWKLYKKIRLLSSLIINLRS